MGYLYLLSPAAIPVTLGIAIAVESLRLRAAALNAMGVAMGFVMANPID